MKIKNKIESLYIHIPFCKKICPYCDFNKIIYNRKIAEKYISNLIKDLIVIKEKFCKFKTIYIGGGTPSILDLDLLEVLLSNLKDMHLKKYEFTIEANPDSITEEKLKLFKKYDVNRISIGIQSFSLKSLKYLGREENYEQENVIKLTKRYFENINLDFIYGYKCININKIKEDLDMFLKLDVKHISIYSLIVEKGTLFSLKGEKEERQDEVRKQYDFICKYLKKHGYNRYEISNFSKKGYESKHNLTYWKDKEYLAIGAGSSGFIKNIRYSISRSITKYNEGNRDLTNEIVSKQDDIKYFLLTNLRLEKGFKLKDFYERFGVNIYDLYKEKIDNLLKNRLVQLNKYTFKVSKTYLYILDYILINFF